MDIKRQMYVDQLMAQRGNGYVKVITGIRRCGKSYLLNVLFRKALIEEGISEDHIIFGMAASLPRVADDFGYG